jgi:nitric oxide reductase NorD protein
MTDEAGASLLALASVRRLVRDRAVLRPGYDQVTPRIARLDEALAGEWARATMELSLVNAGPACIAAFWRAAMNVDATGSHLVVTSGFAAAEICRAAGAKAALACLEQLPTALRLTKSDPASLTAWWQGLGRLAREAPVLVAGTMRHIDRLLGNGGATFADFVAVGLKATARDKARRAAYFALDDPLALATLGGHTGAPGFADCERMIAAFDAGLWGRAARVESAPPGLSRRTMIASGTILLPPIFPGVPSARIRDLYRAATAHAQAHLALPPVRYPLLQLKPLQIAMIGLIEDARVETMAIQRFPGLRRLWAGFHEAQPGGVQTVVTLMARLSRALLDPDLPDGDGFVAKGCALFWADPEQWRDSLFSRRVGGLLANDLGQMRLQFNAKTFVVEPAYRDDNMHLWELPETQDYALSLTVETARGVDDGTSNDTPGEAGPAPRARDAGSDMVGAVLATYPEWDGAAGVERPDWTTVRDTQSVTRAPPAPWLGEAALHIQVLRLVRGNAVGDRVRQGRQEDGAELDLDAAIAATIAHRSGLPADGRWYRDRRPRGRDLATLIILDVSQSTAALSTPGVTVLEAQRRAVAALAPALDAQGDIFAVQAFASAGRDDVRLTRVKDFAEPLGPAVSARLAGLSSGLSTRLGAALRHAGATLTPVRATRKLMLVLTDGEPSDIDVPQPGELVEDARRAAIGLRLRGIDVFGIIMDPAAVGSGAAIFGRHNTMAVGRLDELPARLANVYFRLSQR